MYIKTITKIYTVLFDWQYISWVCFMPASNFAIINYREFIVKYLYVYGFYDQNILVNMLYLCLSIKMLICF